MEVHKTWAELVTWVVRDDPRTLQRHIKPILFPWLLCMHDVVPEVASAAKASFQCSGIKPEKMGALLKFCRKELLGELGAQLHASPQSVGEGRGRTLSAKEAVDVRDNCVSSTLLLLRFLLETYPPSADNHDVDEELVALLTDAVATHIKLKNPPWRRALSSLLTYAVGNR